MGCVQPVQRRSESIRIIGIDPGSRITGYGIIDKQGPGLG
ncbi:MAG: hypothetical protein D3924_10225, partial [Candidatus Electrothrix sp. AR4]|nr:hypothetical protein [Candidatus Electrothrix sp. AR4]